MTNHTGCSLVRQVHDFLRRFENIPDMLELDHLTVSGDVTFGKNVSLKVHTLITTMSDSHGFHSFAVCVG